MDKVAYSAGARYERAAIRKYLLRKFKANEKNPLLEGICKWVQTRQSRYDKKPGGL